MKFYPHEANYICRCLQIIELEKIKEKIWCISIILPQNNKRHVQRQIQIIFVWMIGVIIFIKKHDLKKTKQIKYYQPQDWTWEANQYSWHWSCPTLNLHIIYANVLCYFTKQAPKQTIVSSQVGQYQFICFLHITHNLFLLDVLVHCIE